jgi:ABC-type uncharacterized transport system permease subunit
MLISAALMGLAALITVVTVTTNVLDPQNVNA